VRNWLQVKLKGTNLAGIGALVAVTRNYQNLILDHCRFGLMPLKRWNNRQAD
jgi:hypothetical protein